MISNASCINNKNEAVVIKFETSFELFFWGARDLSGPYMYYRTQVSVKIISALIFKRPCSDFVFEEKKQGETNVQKFQVIRHQILLAFQAMQLLVAA
jgi:hypothetical protein